MPHSAEPAGDRMPQALRSIGNDWAQPAGLFSAIALMALRVFNSAKTVGAARRQES